MTYLDECEVSERSEGCPVDASCAVDVDHVAPRQQQVHHAHCQGQHERLQAGAHSAWRGLGERHQGLERATEERLTCD